MQKLLALLGAKSKEEFLALLAQFIKFGTISLCLPEMQTTGAAS